MEALTIGKAARQAGVNVETIRFYERQQLIEQPLKPTGSGVRLYSKDLVERIRFIREAQQLGFSLREVRELLALRSDPGADCSEVREQAVTKLQEVRSKIERLQQIGAALETLIAACPGWGGLQACSIMDALEHRTDGRAPDKPARASVPDRGTTQEVPMKAATFKIEGMHCNGCANTIKAVVEREPGVQMIAVSYPEREARVLYDPAATDEERLAAAIERPGYRVTGRG